MGTVCCPVKKDETEVVDDEEEEPVTWEPVRRLGDLPFIAELEAVRPGGAGHRKNKNKNKKKNRVLVGVTVAARMLAIVLEDWLQCTSFVDLKSTIVAMCLRSQDKTRTTKPGTDRRFLFQTLAGEVVARASFSKNTNGLELYKFVRVQLAEHANASSTTSSNVFRLWHGTFEIPDAQSVRVQYFVNSGDRQTTVTIVFFPSPYERLERVRAICEKTDTLALSPDGVTFASVSHYGHYSTSNFSTTIRLRTTDSSSSVSWLSINCHVLAVVFSPVGQTLAAGCSNGKVMLYCKEEVMYYSVAWRNSRTFEGHTGAICSLAFSPNGKTLVSASKDRQIRLWSIYSGACVRIFEGHSSVVSSVAFSPCGRTIVSGSWDRTIRIWPVAHDAKRKTSFLVVVMLKPWRSVRMERCSRSVARKMLHCALLNRGLF